MYSYIDIGVGEFVMLKALRGNLLRVFLEFHNNGAINKNINATFICLDQQYLKFQIYKSDQPAHMNHSKVLLGVLIFFMTPFIL